MIITCSDYRARNLDVPSTSDVNPIHVRAASRRGDLEIGGSDVAALLERNVNLLRVLNFQIPHYQVLTVVESESLAKRATTTWVDGTMM